MDTNSTLLLQISMNVSWAMVDVIRTALTFLEAIHAPVLEASSWMRTSKYAMVCIIREVHTHPAGNIHNYPCIQGSHVYSFNEVDGRYIESN